MGYMLEKGEKPEAKGPSKGVGSSFSVEPASLTWSDGVRAWHVRRTMSYVGVRFLTRGLKAAPTTL